MGFRTMKQDLFTIKALQSKGYDIDTILAMSDEEIDKLPISTKLIEGAKLYKLRGGKTPTEIAEDIADMMMRDDTPVQVKEEIIEEYTTVEPIEEVPQVLEVQDEVQVQDVPDAQETEEVQEVDVIRTESSQEDIKIIKESLQRKEAKSVQPFIKHLKSEVPEAILDSVDSTVIANLIEERIAEIKALAEKNK